MPTTLQKKVGNQLMNMSMEMQRARKAIIEEKLEKLTKGRVRNEVAVKRAMTELMRTNQALAL